MGCTYSKLRSKRTKSSIDLGDDELCEVPSWKVEEYLMNRPEVIESYIKEHSNDFQNLYQLLDRQKTINEFTLDLVRSIFNDMTTSIDLVVKKVMACAPKLVDADRASLFLLDTNSAELYTRIYHGNADSTNYHKEIPEKAWQEIRALIAGKVAETGETLNIPDAYADHRFNRAVDQETGYVTKSILCMPIFVRGSIMGVVQLVNKKSGNGVFEEDDVRAFENFALYCGLALHHAKLYDNIRQAEEKCKVALEMLAYHSHCTDEEFEHFISTASPQKPPADLKEFCFITTRMDDNHRIHLTVFMFCDLFGLTRFDKNVLYRFFITVKKNYRRVPYHNWIHAFTVAHCMYCVLKKKNNKFTLLESLSLFVSAVCHDLDHRGKNNQFLVDTSSPLSNIYQSSQMEHHHFNLTVSVIQQEGLNILSRLSSKEYKQVLNIMRHCILATDLTNHFSAKLELNEILTKSKFSWNEPEHRLLAQGIVMTACDLSACAKPWDVHAETVSTIFEEFWEQGDQEKKEGRQPVAMMDRNMAHIVPISQVKFLTNICVGCYKLLCQLIPEAQDLLVGAVQNLDRWKAIAEADKMDGKVISGRKKSSLMHNIKKFSSFSKSKNH